MPLPILIDTHAHLDEQSFEAEIDEVIERARAAGVRGIITIGITADSCRRAIALAEKYPAVWAAVGIHPNYAALASVDDWRVVCELAQHPRVVAVGETGLDRYWDHTPMEVQVDFFERHVALSRETNKPFIVHCREAEAETLAVLDREALHGPLRGVMHSFCGSPETAQRCLDHGLWLSFSGMLTYKKNEELRALAASVPAHRILVETDCPYLAPVPHRGKKNEPAFVARTAATLGEARGLTLPEIAELTTANARALFGMQENS